MLAFPLLESAQTVRQPIASNENGIDRVGRHSRWRRGRTLRDENGIDRVGWHSRWRRGCTLRDENGIDYVGRHSRWRRGRALRLDCSVVPSGQCRRFVDRYRYGQ